MAEYLYCIIARKDAPKHFPIEGFDGAFVRCVPYLDLAAVVSETELKDYEPNEENVARHKQVALHALEKHTVLPVAFGMVFKTRGVLISTMRKVCALLRRSLRLVDGKVELGVKVVFTEKPENKGEAISKLDTDFVESLAKVAVESKKGKLFSKKLALNRSFLVDREKIEEFSAVLSKLSEKYKQLKIKYTGPWPPYNFVDIRIMAKGRGG